MLTGSSAGNVDFKVGDIRSLLCQKGEYQCRNEQFIKKELMMMAYEKSESFWISMYKRTCYCCGASFKCSKNSGQAASSQRTS
jgi:hypothetical protein